MGRPTCNHKGDPIQGLAKGRVGTLNEELHAPVKQSDKDQCNVTDKNSKCNPSRPCEKPSRGSSDKTKSITSTSIMSKDCCRGHTKEEGGPQYHLIK